MCLREDYNLMTAQNAQEALEVIQQHIPDLILLDIMMPDISGFTLCTKLKNEPQTKNLPIIFITAKDSTEDLIKGLELGADDYITKPFKPAEVLARVKSTLRIYERFKDQAKRRSFRPPLHQPGYRRHFPYRQGSRNSYPYFKRIFQQRNR